MNEVAERIIEKLEEKCDVIVISKEEHLPFSNVISKPLIIEKDYDTSITIKEAIEIVKQAAENYNNVIVDGKYCFQTCACTEKCDKCSRLCNGDIDWYENIDYWEEDYNNGWIPCSERMPEEHEYMQYNPAPYMRRLEIAYLTDTIDYKHGYYDGYKWMDKAHNIIENVVAWKIHQPYQPKGEKL